MDVFFSLQIFRKVAESRSFKAAAEHFMISPTAVSKHVQALEDRVGTRLLHRTTRVVSLTEAGQLYLRRSTEILELLHETESQLSLAQAQPRGLLRIGGPAGFGTMYLSHVIVRFMKRYPDIKVDFQMSDRFVDLIEEGYDLTVRIASKMKDSDLIAVKLGKVRAVTVATPAYFKKHGIPKKPEDLMEHECLTTSLQNSVWHFEERGRPKSVHVSGRFVVSGTNALKAALLEDFGIASLPYFYVAKEIESGKLKVVLTNYEMSNLNLYILYPKSRTVPSKVRAFVDFLKEEAKNMGYLG